MLKNVKKELLKGLMTEELREELKKEIMQEMIESEVAKKAIEDARKSIEVASKAKEEEIKRIAIEDARRAVLEMKAREAQKKNENAKMNMRNMMQHKPDFAVDMRLISKSVLKLDKFVKDKKALDAEIAKLNLAKLPSYIRTKNQLGEFVTYGIDRAKRLKNGQLEYGYKPVSKSTVLN